MAGHQRCQAIARHRLRSGARRGGATGHRGQPGVRHRGTGRDRARGHPARAVEGRSGWEFARHRPRIGKPSIDPADHLRQHQVVVAGQRSMVIARRGRHARWCESTWLDPGRARPARIATGEQISGAQTPSFHAPSIRATALRSGHDASHRRARRVRRRRSHGSRLARHAPRPRSGGGDHPLGRA